MHRWHNVLILAQSAPKSFGGWVPPRPAGGSLQRSPRPLRWIGGSASRQRKDRRREKVSETGGKEGKGMKGRGREKGN